ncbi:unnamed protein product [Psylliodes chrysocephalus]|uniref:Uncharacterized protein n=2 Tax=Psylliodes chrysocephalus TaxID=3402493 RepID=A0A9P0CQY9_9CUCU|nr:unnamed protein product [Psylliodes chrysocephala]
MSSKHLTLGSEDPPKTEGLLRLYSMKFCPFAQRARLVLNAKNIPHEIININLIEKPEWYIQINEKGLVPCLIDGPKTITESLDIADYLNDKYPEPPLYPADPEAKKRDQELIQKAGPAQGILFKILLSKDDSTTPEEWAKLLVDSLQDLENELGQRGTPFFGGENPGMVDYMIWPWAERAGSITCKLGKKLPLKDSDIPLLRKWRKSMLQHPVCKELYIDGERFWKIFVPSKITNEMPLYDEV